MSKVKTACVIHYWGKAFSPIGECAVRSFKKFHPEVDVVHINDKNHHTFKSLRKTKDHLKGSERLVVAKELMEDKGYDKVIILGADTITCDYLSEFMHDMPREAANTSMVEAPFVADVIATFDYDYPIQTTRYRNSIWGDEQHLNADVVCFNGTKAIDAMLEILEDPVNTESHDNGNQYGEQGALNEVFYSKTNGVRGAWAEVPTHGSFMFQDLEQMATQMPLCHYNVRSKSTLFADYRDEHGNRYYEYKKVLCESRQLPWKEFVGKFHCTNDKLWAGDGRQIKVWHYCEGFGSGTAEQMNQLLGLWKTQIFNEETKKFFREQCDCEFFFPEDE